MGGLEKTDSKQRGVRMSTASKTWQTHERKKVPSHPATVIYISKKKFDDLARQGKRRALSRLLSKFPGGGWTELDMYSAGGTGNLPGRESREKSPGKKEPLLSEHVREEREIKI